jgi:4,5:9,10-diseco-3-hydroxy-5,9,17-trioxoandrosta-1(10),2-diene-4-oate hydrolase
VVDRLAVRQVLIDQIGVPVTQGTVAAGRIQTSYLEAGGGPPLLLVHGASGGAVNWYKVIGLLSERFHVIAPDVVGFGESDKPSGAYDRPFYAAWLLSFVDALALQDTYLVGSSQGGAISLQFAHDHPHRVRKLVQLNAGATGNWDPENKMPAFLQMMFLHAYPTRWMMRHLCKYMVYSMASFDEALVDYFYGVLKMPGARNWFWEGRGSAVAPMPKDELAEVTTETLLLWGEADPMFPLSAAQAAFSVMPNARLETFPKCGHLPYLDVPEKLVKALSAYFLGS